MRAGNNDGAGNIHERGGSRRSLAEEGEKSYPLRGDVTMTGKADHIGVCICTYKRPFILQDLLQKLERQPCDGSFAFSIHVVDNDAMKSAEQVVKAACSASPIDLTYDVEPVQNIALTRNRAVNSSRGNFIAFMDDDEIPCEDWLIRLYAACREYDADGVLGPVRPFYTPDTPSWLKKSGLCERASHPSGTVLNFLQTRTGNVLFKRSILDGTEVPFPPEMGRTGGEDIDFFRRMMDRGHRFVWCEEAPVYEHILPERRKRLYHVDKYLRIGGLTGETLNHPGVEKWKGILRAGLSMLFFGILAVGGIARPHIFMRNAVKSAYYLGIASGCLGYVPVRERRDG